MVPQSQLIETAAVMAYCSRTISGVLYGQKLAGPALMRIGLNIVRPYGGRLSRGGGVVPYCAGSYGISPSYSRGCPANRAVAKQHWHCREWGVFNAGV